MAALLGQEWISRSIKRGDSVLRRRWTGESGRWSSRSLSLSSTGGMLRLIRERNYVVRWRISSGGRFFSATIHSGCLNWGSFCGRDSIARPLPCVIMLMMMMINGKLAEGKRGGPYQLLHLRLITGWVKLPLIWYGPSMAKSDELYIQLAWRVPAAFHFRSLGFRWFQDFEAVFVLLLLLTSSNLFSLIWQDRLIVIDCRVNRKLLFGGQIELSILAEIS